MTALELALAATVLLLLPMLHFLFASITFLLRPLSDPIVTWLLRGLVAVDFLLAGLGCGLAALAFALAGLPLAAAGLAAVAGLAVAARAWFVGRMDRELRARDAGDGGAVRRLRRLHWGGMLYNAAQCAAIVVSVPRIFPGPG